MKRIAGFLAGIVLLLLLSSGIFADIIEFFTWLFMLQYKTPEISMAGDIIVRGLTFAVAYTLVGLIFKSLGRKVMSIAYFIISTLLGFVLAYIVMLIETYLLEIGIVLGIIFVVSIISLIIIRIKSKCLSNEKESK